MIAKPILYKLLCLSIVLTTIPVIVSCGFTSVKHDVLVTRDISDPNSSLLKVLDCEKLSQKTKAVKWSTILIRQGNFDSTKYKTSAEYAACALNGIYQQGSTKIGISLSTDLRRYDGPMSLDRDIVSLGDYVSEKSVSLSLLSMGRKMYVNCGERLNNDLMCMVGTQFNQTDVLQIKLLLSNAKMSLVEIENLINMINGEANKTLGN
ncbi:MAG TPA: hypothetical protein VK206_08355 [Anaerolineales bacterium]|nr:hypothetical protein [Anaerolineales bacterium]HLO33510.1 hypothetical protein [Anaerolineales bacterium]